ncbi:hypothetical protein KUTeg_005739 [Tegillarca granosa]|uniref:TAFH domain-containing protein n=1 Tax=Tegillarca granosa TaxID=220873 RepID=A0ABQ9FHG5_TEGGR|nr:hypothetical protein KUTeg_005739 [Tegillarca granosa]
MKTLNKWETGSGGKDVCSGCGFGGSQTWRSFISLPLKMMYSKISSLGATGLSVGRSSVPNDRTGKHEKCEEMAAANPLEDLLSSEIDESAVSALVGSLESRLASPTNKDIVNSLSDTSVNNNHISNTGTLPCTTSVFSNVHTVTQGHKGASLPNNVTIHNSSTVIAKCTNSNSQISEINSLINSNDSNVVAGGVTTYVNAHTPNSPANQSPNTCAINRTASQPQAIVNARNSPVPTVNANNVTFVNNVPLTSTITTSQMTNHTLVGVTQNAISNHTTLSLPSSVVHTLSNISTDQKPVLSLNNAVHSVNQSDLKSGPIVIKQESTTLNAVKNERVNSPHVQSQFIVKQEPLRTNSPGVHIKQESRQPAIQTVQSVPASHMHTGQVTVTGSHATQATSVHIVNTPIKGQPGSSGNSGVITVRTPGPSSQTHVVMRPQIISTQSPQSSSSQMQVVNVTGGNAIHRHAGTVHLTQGKRVNITAASPVRPQQINIAPRPGVTGGTITLPPGLHIPPGTVLMRNEHGNLMFPPSSSAQGQARPPGTQIVTIQHPSGQTTGGTSPHTVLRQHTPVTAATSPQVQLHDVRNSNISSPVPPISTPPTVVPNNPVAIQPGPSQPQAVPQQQQQHMLDNVKKCKNFLSTLIKLAANQPAQTDGKVEPEMFTERLQIELRSSPQPYLVPFLKKSLPLLRQSLIGKEMTIEGVRAPPVEVLQQAGVSIASTVQSGQIHQVTPAFVQQPQQMVYASKGQSGHIQVRHTAKGVPITIQNRNIAIPKTVVAVSSKSGTHVTGLPSTVEALQGQSAGKTHKEKPKYEALKDDDDINDVATMGGVNLSEESRNILASNADFIGTQIRSCKDEICHVIAKLAKLNFMGKASKHGIDDISNEVVNLVSHATQERLRDVLEKLAAIAEHRIEIYKMNDKFEITKDVKSQLKFLDELDKLEKKRHEEQEWEKIMKAARSRSKNEDPEQQKIKQKAKEFDLYYRAVNNFNFLFLDAFTMLNL